MRAPVIAGVVIALGCPSFLACLFDKHPGWLQKGIGYQTNDRSHRHQGRVIDLPTKQHAERREADQGGQPVAHGDPGEQDAGAEDRADRRRIGAPGEALHVRIAAATQQQRRRDQDVEKRRQEDADSRGERPPEASHLKARRSWRAR